MTLAEIRVGIERRAAVLGASGNQLPTYGRTDDFARPHLEIDSRGYHRVVVERGVELGRITTPDLEELLYHVFSSITFSLTAYAPRVKRQNARRQIFRLKVELLAKLNPTWAARCAEQHRQVLIENPFIPRRYFVSTCLQFSVGTRFA